MTDINPMTLCARCSHRRELHRPAPSSGWAPGVNGPCQFLGRHGGNSNECHGDAGAKCQSFVEVEVPV